MAISDLSLRREGEFLELNHIEKCTWGGPPRRNLRPEVGPDLPRIPHHHHHHPPQKILDQCGSHQRGQSRTQPPETRGSVAACPYRESKLKTSSCIWRYFLFSLQKRQRGSGSLSLCFVQQALIKPDSAGGKRHKPQRPP